jgi:ABC-2 type transport system ATP-binding protein
MCTTLAARRGPLVDPSARPPGEAAPKSQGAVKILADERLRGGDAVQVPSAPPVRADGDGVTIDTGSYTAAPEPAAALGAEPPVDPSSLVVELRHVGKRFGSVPALSDLNLFVPKGRITVLLGPNGAGKTTAIRVITGALEPDHGHVRTFGWDPARFGEEVRKRCGVVSAKPALYDRLSGWDNMQYSAELYGLGRNATAQIREAAGRFGILDALDQQVGGFSTGMKTRLALARSVLHDPELLLFDEPTSGLDPESSKAVLDLIREMTAEGRTVVMCTHLLIEAEGLADQIIVLESGTDLLHGSQNELIKRYWPNQLVWVDAEDPAQLEVLSGMDGVIAMTRNGRKLTEVQVDDVTRVPDLIDALVAKGVRLTRVEPHEPTLEELYFAVRKERRDLGVEDDL